jgi:UDP-GlcNAc:undecaprenyl-phosphate GlcNAc-1-phosphate transferase
LESIVTWTAALLLTTISIALLRPIAGPLGLVDRPSHRKRHTGEVPLVGGVAIGIAMAVTFGVGASGPGGWGLLVACLLMLAIGVWDDVRKVSSGARLLLQALAVLALSAGAGVVIEDLGRLGIGGELLALGAMALPFTVFAGVGVINAVNMSDGMDGLCGLLSLAALVGLGIVAALAGRPFDFALIVGLSGALIGFLAFNFRIPGRPQAMAFLGDGGSYLIGILFVFLTIRLSQGPDPAMTPVTALWFLLVPLLDTVGMILRRLHRGRSPFAADREHLHHIFLLARFTVTETVLIMGGLALGGVGIGLAGLYAGVPESLMLAAFLAVGIGYYWMIMRAWKVMRFLSRSINRRVGRGDRRVAGDRRRRDDPTIVARLGRDRRSGLDRRRGEKDRRLRSSQPLGGAALQPRDYPAGTQARSQTGKAG